MNAYAGQPRSLVRITLRLVPLTPIHIGDGTELRPNEYLLEEPTPANTRYDEFGEEVATTAAPAISMLCRFDPVQAIRLMSATQNSAFRAALDAGKLGEAARALREAGQGAIIERIPISARSAAELRKAFADPEARSGQVKPFIRSGGRPIIPGSSIKGAFRTALASAFLPREHHPVDGWTHERAMQEAFGLEHGKTETDPLRFLHVADAVLPHSMTVIDRTELVKLGGTPATSSRGGIQMHYERTRALTDGEPAPVFDVPIAIDRRAVLHGPHGVRRSEARFDAMRLVQACRMFHQRLFTTEMDRFFRGDTKNILQRKLLGHRSPDGRHPVENNAWNRGFVLLRLGRFGHFESKSLEGVRRGHFPQAKEPAKKTRAPDEWGTTRTVTRDANGNPIPFGWVIGWVVEERQP
ncbi:RAMP superfamily CRISPR-associated protein [Elioraea thermophila]|uniref:RAMP superfamily CRISPR-associated protein n=1 Tax=Elioraea thermophila TaxID=2185104 RepID=UPI000DF1103F|nr:RAMP superfamily CRISPR-associated protein [Elioraea thermophila]